MNEIGRSWIRLVLFDFEAIKDIETVLETVPEELLSEIRGGYGEMLHYSVQEVLSRFPSLQLDLLTVHGRGDPFMSYLTIETLITQGDGWKELHYINRATVSGISKSPFLNALIETPVTKPSAWESVLDGRDGVSTKPSVTLYRSTDPSVRGAVLRPEKRERFDPKCLDLSHTHYTDSTSFVTGLSRSALKEVLVVAKRGFGVDYKQKPFDFYNRNEGHDVDNIEPFPEPVESDWSLVRPW
ncbi:hypothetical protein ONZ43_g5081 [Nemania bipapillata]|uniref:Uncharacterized protein n=1 Tax=Nemania bipapillata TaxID=110536 RepID=A0ACC2IF39_9PEZI|nr:hypothetical protein ONZ43_g5081 [Nemania bipapillata]